MRLTESELKEYIRSELSRETIISEGILDFLGKMFDKLVGWISGLGEQLESAVDDAVADSEKAADKLDAESDGKKLSAEDYMKAVAYSQLTNFESALGKLLEAEKAKTWGPKDDSKEAAEAWQKTPDAEAAGNIWDAVGKLAGSLRFLGNPKYVGDAASGKLAEKLMGKMESPADAITGVSEAADGLTRMWSSAEKNFDFEGSANNVKPSEVLAVLKKIQSLAKKIAGKISASAKEVKESLALRSWVILEQEALDDSADEYVDSIASAVNTLQDLADSAASPKSKEKLGNRAVNISSAVSNANDILSKLLDDLTSKGEQSG